MSRSFLDVKFSRKDMLRLCTAMAIQDEVLPDFYAFLDRRVEKKELGGREELSINGFKKSYFEARMSKHVELSLQAAIDAENMETAKRTRTLFDAIKHGDEEHQAWLREAIDTHFRGEKVIPLEGLVDESE